MWPRSSLFRRKARSVPTLQVTKPRLRVDCGVPGYYSIRKPVSLTCYSPAAQSPNSWGAWWWAWWRSQGHPWKCRAVGPFGGKMDKREHLSFRSFQSESAWRTKPVDILKPVWNSSILAPSAHSARLTFHCRAALCPLGAGAGGRVWGENRLSGPGALTAHPACLPSAPPLRGSHPLSIVRFWTPGGAASSVTEGRVRPVGTGWGRCQLTPSPCMATACGLPSDLCVLLGRRDLGGRGGAVEGRTLPSRQRGLSLNLSWAGGPPAGLGGPPARLGEQATPTSCLPQGAEEVPCVQYQCLFLLCSHRPQGTPPPTPAMPPQPWGLFPVQN